MITCGVCIALGHAARLLPASDTARVARVLTCFRAVLGGGGARPALCAFGASVGCGVLLARIGCDDEWGPGAEALAHLFDVALAAPAGTDPLVSVGAWLGIALAAHMPLRSAAARSAVRNIWDGARAAAEAAAASRVACPAWLAIGSLTVRCVVAEIITVPDAKSVAAAAAPCLEWDEFCAVALPTMIADFAVRACAPRDGSCACGRACVYYYESL
jgi:hypothetical protein